MSPVILLLCWHMCLQFTTKQSKAYVTGLFVCMTSLWEHLRFNPLSPGNLPSWLESANFMYYVCIWRDVYIFSLSLFLSFMEINLALERRVELVFSPFFRNQFSVWHQVLGYFCMWMCNLCQLSCFSTFLMSHVM